MHAGKCKLKPNASLGEAGMLKSGCDIFLAGDMRGVSIMHSDA